MPCGWLVHVEKQSGEAHVSGTRTGLNRVPAVASELASSLLWPARAERTQRFSRLLMNDITKSGWAKPYYYRYLASSMHNSNLHRQCGPQMGGLSVRDLQRRKDTLPKPPPSESFFLVFCPGSDFCWELSESTLFSPPPFPDSVRGSSISP